MYSKTFDNTEFKHVFYPLSVDCKNVKRKRDVFYEVYPKEAAAGAAADPPLRCSAAALIAAEFSSDL